MLNKGNKVPPSVGGGVSRRQLKYTHRLCAAPRSCRTDAQPPGAARRSWSLSGELAQTQSPSYTWERDRERRRERPAEKLWLWQARCSIIYPHARGYESVSTNIPLKSYQAFCVLTFLSLGSPYFSFSCSNHFFLQFRSPLPSFILLSIYLYPPLFHCLDLILSIFPHKHSVSCLSVLLALPSLLASLWQKKPCLWWSDISTFTDKSHSFYLDSCPALLLFETSN